ncbi:hypothetical protein ABZ208_13170 [Streptomyces sp. NPDC006208]|uniref:hypothetical protein n=1 Tax=Streptomyces sp. NPDC006208 TaxID=3156734 RepID=UPI0033BE1838
MADRQRALPRPPGALRRWAPPPALTGFLVLLVVTFALSYRVGSAVGPVAPGMHSTGTGAEDGSGPRDGGGVGDSHSGGGH